MIERVIITVLIIKPIRVVTKLCKMRRKGTSRRRAVTRRFRISLLTRPLVLVKINRARVEIRLDAPRVRSPWKIVFACHAVMPDRVVIRVDRDRVPGPTRPTSPIR